jgi:hypothetical protein
MITPGIEKHLGPLANRANGAHFSGRKDFLPVEPLSGLSFLFLLGAPRFA